jgi:hypothetical protein
MVGLLWFILAMLVSPFRSNARLQAENAALRQQMVVLRRKCQGRVRLRSGDRLFFIQLYRWFGSLSGSIDDIDPSAEFACAIGADLACKENPDVAVLTRQYAIVWHNVIMAFDQPAALFIDVLYLTDGQSVSVLQVRSTTLSPTRVWSCHPPTAHDPQLRRWRGCSE